jgi:sec-independent protein translocase protein TatB
MFDIGSPELLLVLIVTLLVIGPQRLPETIRTLARWWMGLKRSLSQTRAQIEEEIGFDRIRQQLDEEGVVEEIKAMSIELNSVAKDAGAGLKEAEKPADPSHWPGMPPPE